MADVKISALGAIGSVAGEDLVAIVDDPSGTPASRKATITQIATFINASALTASSTATFTNKTFDVEGTGNSISNIDVADLKSGVLDTDISSVSGSDDTIPSAKAVKTYVDAQIATEDTISELNDTTITSVGDNELLQYDSTSSKWINQTLAEAGISPVAGSSSIVTVGTIATGVWNGTAIAQAYIAGDAINGSKIADDSIDSEHIVDGSVDVAHMSANSIDSDQYVDGSVDNVHLATGIDATKIADGSVTSTEFQYINTLSSNAQTQLDAKAPLASPTFTGTVTTALVDVAGNNIDNIQNIIHDISTTGLDIDFSEDQLQTYSVSGNVTFTTFQNITAGKSKTIRVSADGTDRVLTFPANIRWLGTAPDSNTYTVTANKMAILTFTSFSTDEANILGVFALEE